MSRGVGVSREVGVGGSVRDCLKGGGRGQGDQRVREESKSQREKGILVVVVYTDPPTSAVVH